MNLAPIFILKQLADTSVPVLFPELSRNVRAMPLPIKTISESDLFQLHPIFKPWRSDTSTNLLACTEIGVPVSTRHATIQNVLLNFPLFQVFINDILISNSPLGWLIFSDFPPRYYQKSILVCNNLISDSPGFSQYWLLFDFHRNHTSISSLERHM